MEDTGELGNKKGKKNTSSVSGVKYGNGRGGSTQRKPKSRAQLDREKKAREKAAAKVAQKSHNVVMKNAKTYMSLQKKADKTDKRATNATMSVKPTGGKSNERKFAKGERLEEKANAYREKSDNY